MSKEVRDRRALLKGIVAGSAVVGGAKTLPEQWSKPLTDSVVLPGHARTTGDYNLGDYSEENDGYGYHDSSDDTDTGSNPAYGGDYTYGDAGYDDGTDDAPDGDESANDGQT